MANSFGSFYVGNSGLSSSQNALNVTANNLANVDTKGYVRQQVIFSDRHYNEFRSEAIGVNVQQAGLGVSIGDVVHARDVFLDKAYRQESGRQAFYQVSYDSCQQVEDLFQELDGEEYKQSVQDLLTAFQELAKAPGDSVNENLVIQKSELFLERTKVLYSDLQSYQSNLNEQIEDGINRVNEIGQRIYELNLYVQKVEAAGVETAMTARDERDALLDELAQYGTVSTREDYTGFVYVDFQEVGFVQEYGCNEIGLKSELGTGFYTPYWPHLSDLPHEQYYQVFKTGTAVSAEDNTDIGKIKALLYQRGDNYGRWEDIATSDAYSKIEHSTLMEMEAQVDMMFHQVATTMNDLFCPNTTTTEPMIYLNSAGERMVLPAGTKILDTANCNVGADGKLPPQEIFKRIGYDRYTELKGADGKSIYVYNEEKEGESNSKYQIGSVEINLALKQQESLLPTISQNGAVDYDLGARIIAAWENQGMTINPNDNSPCTFEEYYDKMIGNLGTKGNVYSSENDTLKASATSLDNQRTQVTGVSSDEELTKMIRYQSAYNAASRYITVISQMTELIVTGLK